MKQPWWSDVTIPAKQMALVADWAEKAHRALSEELAEGRIDCETLRLLLEGLRVMAKVLVAGPPPRPQPRVDRSSAS